MPPELRKSENSETRGPASILAVLQSVCEEVAARPYQLATRFLASHLVDQQFGPEWGGVCVEKSIVVLETANRLGLKGQLVLGGFGARELLSDDEASARILTNENPDRVRHFRHVAVLVNVEGVEYLLEASGGKIGAFAFSQEDTKALLAHRASLVCPNLEGSLFYSKFPQDITEVVVRAKLSERRIVRQVVERVGLAAFGRWLVVLDTGVEDTNPTDLLTACDFHPTAVLIDPLLKAVASAHLHFYNQMPTVKLVRMAQEWTVGTKLVRS